jgi:ABC-type spermidine/putrescine transport system permease subunit II
VPDNRVTRHLQVLGILWLVYAALRAIGRVFGAIFLHHLFPQWSTHWGSMGEWNVSALWPVIIAFALTALVLCLVTGYALLTRQPWGRTLAIIAAILMLIHPFLGTALGIYTLWVLAPRTSGDEYVLLSSGALRT